jgi:hypothetical protein
VLHQPTNRTNDDHLLELRSTIFCIAAAANCKIKQAINLLISQNDVLFDISDRTNRCERKNNDRIIFFNLPTICGVFDSHR